MSDVSITPSPISTFVCADSCSSVRLITNPYDFPDTLSPKGGRGEWCAERTAFVITDRHPAAGNRGFTAHHHMIDLTTHESGGEIAALDPRFPVVSKLRQMAQRSVAYAG